MRQRWRAGRCADIAEGLPQVYAATSEAFVAQMLNLDLLGAIAFDKGCYTGQEVIARAHYRGRVKRRMQRWLNGSGISLQARGCRARPRRARADRGARCGAAGRATGNSRGGQLRGGDRARGGNAPAAETASAEVSGPLPLPYSLPE